MLSRVADCQFWMSRYLERAECVARLLDVAFHLELDLSGVTTGPHELNWTGLLAILQTSVPPDLASHQTPQTAVVRWLTFDLENPVSILCCVNRARNNARSIRGSLSPGMWRELNKLYLQLRDPDFAHCAEESPHDFYQAVQVGNQLFHGVCDATLPRDEGWQFIQLGKYLERADKHLRVLDVQYHLIHDLTDPADHSLAALRWAGVLRSCAAYEQYRRFYIGRVEPESVVEFLLLHPQFPQSVRFSVEAAAQALHGISRLAGGERESTAERLLGRAQADLRYTDLKQVLLSNLHGFLESILHRCNQASQAVQEEYFLRR